MKTKLALLTIVCALASCTLPPIEDGNPLDRPGDGKNAATLHEENVEAITGFPYVKRAAQ